MAAIINALADYAKKESPVLTGAPKAPTAEKGTGGDIIATCAYVLAALEGIDLSDYAKTTDLDEYAKKVSPALSGTPTAPTAAKTVNNTQIATTAFVHLLAGAANNGGIVDSLLAQNGYVKFANGLILQWGANLHGWVIFPIPFSQFRRLVTNHQGKVFMDSKAVESNSLSGFTLDVRNNNDSSEDAQWIAIGC